MQDQQANKKKRLKILLFIMVVYIVIVSSIALYAKFYNDTPTISINQNAVENRVEEPNEKQILDVEDNYQSITSDGAGEQDSDFFIDIDDEEAFEREYAKYLGSSLADVPARPLAESEEVLKTSDLVHVVEQKKGLFDRIVDSVYAFFSRKDQKGAEVLEETMSMRTEVDAEIQEMQPHFSLYKENNGVTYIDHQNKPMRLESNGFYIYIGVAPNGFTFHRTIIRYSGEDEIDLQSILIQTSSSDRASIIKATDDVLQRKVTTAVNEWVDLPPTQENNALLNSIVSSDEVKVTFMGTKKNIEWVLTENELATLRETLHFYKLLKEKEELSK